MTATPETRDQPVADTGDGTTGGDRLSGTAGAAGGEPRVADDSPEALDALRREVRALVEDWESTGRFVPTCDAWLRGFDLDFSKDLGAYGMLGLTWPTEVGGAGRSNRARLVVTEELLRAGAPVAAHWIAERQIGPAVLRYGAPEMQRDLLPRIAAGELTICLGMSETESGSDLASVRTTAAQDDDGDWRITGRKIWTSQAHRSTHAYVLARTSRGERKHEGLTEFVVDMTEPGVEVRPIHDLRGEHHFNEVTFDGVHVPAGNVLGIVGDGWKQVTEQLSFERGGMERVLSTYPLLAAVLDGAGAGRDDVDDAVAVELGRAYARLSTLRSAAWDIAGALDAGEAPVLAAAMLKEAGNVFERDVDELARRVLDTEADPSAPGITGLLAAGVLAAPGFSIRGGTSEVLRTIIARSATSGVPRAPDGTEDLREVAADVLEGHGGDPGEGVPPVWATVRELEWHLVGVDESRGGAGGSLRDLAVLAEATGRHGVAVPLVETAAAAQVLAAAGRALPTGTVTVVFGGQLRDGVLSGTVGRAPWAEVADQLVVMASDGHGGEVAVLVDRTTVRVEGGRNLASEPRDTVVLDGVRVPPDAVLPDAPPVAEVRALLALLRAAQTVGALEAAFEHTRRHVSERVQFGKPLIAFQAVGHGLAAVVSELTLARTSLDAAVRAWEARDGHLEAVAASRVVVGAAATEVARVAHQLHGAMGVTREHPLHLSTRRLWSWRDEVGTERSWALQLGRTAVGLGSEGTWAWLTRVVREVPA